MVDSVGKELAVPMVLRVFTGYFKEIPDPHNKNCGSRKASYWADNKFDIRGNNR